MAACRGEIALGVRIHSHASATGWVHLNPQWDMTWTLQEADELVVLTTYDLGDADAPQVQEGDA